MAERETGEQPRRATGAPRLARPVALVFATISVLVPILGSDRAQAGPNDVVLSGRAWRDDNSNATLDSNEYGLAGLTVRATAQRGDVVTGVTAANGSYLLTVDRTAGPAWRIEVVASSTYEASQLTAQNATTVQFVNVATNATGTVVVGNTALVDRRFVPAPIECYSAYLTNYADDSVRKFSPPDGTGIGTPQAPPLNGSGAQAWGVANGDMEEPRSLVLSPAGDVYVGEEDEDEIGRYNGNTGAYLDDVEPENMNDTRGLTYGLDGRMYVADNDDRRIWWIEPATLNSGTFANTNEFNLGGSDNREPEQGLAWLNNNLYVSTGPAPGKVLEINSSGSRTGRMWTLDYTARGMRVGPDNLLYVVSGNGSSTGGLWRIDPVANTSTRLLTGHSFADVVFGPDNSLFLVEEVTGKVRRYAWPAMSAMADYLPQAGTTGYTHSQPKGMIWWRGLNACPSEVRTYEIANRVWSDVNANGLQDPTEPGIPSVTVQLYERGPDNAFGTNDDVLATSTGTDYLGNFRFSNLPERSYEVRFSSGVLPFASGVTTANVGSNDLIDSEVTARGAEFVLPVTTGPTMVDAHSFDAGFRLATGSIGGTLFADDNNNGMRDNSEGVALANAYVQVVNANGGVLQETRADILGNYTIIGLRDNDYKVRIKASETGNGTLWASSTGTPGNTVGPFEAAPDPDDNLVGRDDGTFVAGTGHTDSALLTLTAGSEPTTDGDDANTNRTVDFGFFRPSSIGDRVWSDHNRNGIQDNGEGVILDRITVALQTSAGGAIRTTTTDANGLYRFDGVSSGTYRLEFQLPGGYLGTSQDVGDDTLDSDTDANNRTGTITIDTTSSTNMQWDMGVLAVSLGDLVFDDRNNNGLRDAGEQGIAGVDVNLLDSAGTAQLATATTATDGTFSFRGLPAGTYRLRIPFSSLYAGTAVGFVSSGGSVAESGSTLYEPAADPDNDIDNDDNGTGDWSSGDVMSDPITLERRSEPMTEDSDFHTNYTNDFALHKPEGLYTGGNYYNTVMNDRPMAYYRLGDIATTTLADASGNARNGTYVNSGYTQNQTGAIVNDADKSVLWGGTAKGNVDNLPVNTAAGARTTVEFWMYWNGTQGVMPFGFNYYDLWTNNNRFGFNSACSDVYGVATAGLANRWVHVVAVFTNANTSQNRLYIDGARRNLSGTITCNQSVTSIASISGWRGNAGYNFGGRIDEVSIYNGELSAEQVAAHYTAGSGLAPVPPLTYTISTHAGNGSSSQSGDGGAATAAGLSYTGDVATGPDGSVYIASYGYGTVRKVAPNGTISTIATTSGSGWKSITLGPDGFLYMTDYQYCVVRRIATDGSSNVIVWGATSSCSTAGDGGPANASRLNRPMSIAFDSAGHAYIAEYSGYRIRKVDMTTGVITTHRSLGWTPWGITFDSTGNMYVSQWSGSFATYRFAPDGTSTTLWSGQYAMQLDFDSSGRLWFAGWSQNHVRFYKDGVITSVMENNGAGFAGDGGIAESARLYYPTAVAISGTTVYIADFYNYRVRKLTLT